MYWGNFCSFTLIFQFCSFSFYWYAALHFSYSGRHYLQNSHCLYNLFSFYGRIFIYHHCLPTGLGLKTQQIFMSNQLLFSPSFFSLHLKMGFNFPNGLCFLLYFTFYFFLSFHLFIYYFIVSVSSSS